MTQFYDTQPTGENHQVDYRDPTDIPEIAEEIAKGKKDPISINIALWIRTKMWRRHVREALARAVEWFSVRFYEIKDHADKTREISQETRERQTTLEGQFKDVLANATVDSEVINARDSQTFGKFIVLDDRFENIETLVNRYIPIGFDFIIPHNMGTNPNVVVKTYDYGLGTEPNGFDSVPGMFGGTPSKMLPFEAMYQGGNTVLISLPYEYRMENSEVIKSKYYPGVWYLNEGIKTIKIELTE